MNKIIVLGANGVALQDIPFIGEMSPLHRLRIGLVAALKERGEDPQAVILLENERVVSVFEVVARPNNQTKQIPAANQMKWVMLLQEYKNDPLAFMAKQVQASQESKTAEEDTHREEA